MTYSGFQSSPALSGRCNVTSVCGPARAGPVSILTGPFGPVQPSHGAAAAPRARVSILTGPFGPVQPPRSSPAADGRCRGFNPHRPFRAGATGSCCWTACPGSRFQSSPALSGRCNVDRSGVASSLRGFQSSPALSGRCNVPTAQAGPAEPGFQSSPALSGRCNRPVPRAGRAQPRRFQSSPALSGRCNTTASRPCMPRHRVSILTGPFGPVQRIAPPAGAQLAPEFQSSPALSGRCNRAALRTWRRRGRFQSSPALSGRCNRPALCASRHSVTGFNPHRPFRAGATCTGRSRGRQAEFQSSPALSGRCNRGTRRLQAPGRRVSILTGPFGPVQPRRARGGHAARQTGFNPHRPFRAGATARAPTAAPGQLVSILTGPFGPVQRPSAGHLRPPSGVFQSSPALSGRCNAGRMPRSGPVRRFQSSPALSGRCNPEASVEVPRRQVSILTGPFGPVQPLA